MCVSESVCVREQACMAHTVAVTHGFKCLSGLKVIIGGEMREAKDRHKQRGLREILAPMSL